MGVLKEFKNPFCRYYNRLLSLEHRLVSGDDKSEKFHEDFLKLGGMGIKQAAKEDLFGAIKIFLAKYSRLTSELDWFINRFTNIDEVSDEQIENDEERLLSENKQISNVEYSDRDECVITFEDGESFKFSRLSTNSDVLKMLPHLNSSERQGKCHASSLLLADCEDGENIHCVTGEIWSFTSGMKVVHSWVELEGEEGVICIDNNINAYMKKEDFQKIYHPREISRIRGDQVYNDRHAIIWLNRHSTRETPYLRLYCVSRDEAMKIYNKKLQQDSRLGGM